MRFPAARRSFWSIYGHFVWDTGAPPDAATHAGVVALVQARTAISGETVLDVGCGTGTDAFALGEAGFRVIGIDYAAGMLARARASRAEPVATARLRACEPRCTLTLSRGELPARHRHQCPPGRREPHVHPGRARACLAAGGTLVVLHVPRPLEHRLPLHRAIRQQLGRMRRKTPLCLLLVTLKCCAERWGHTRYWTAAELEVMLTNAGFVPLVVQPGPPILITAMKSRAGSLGG